MAGVAATPPGPEKEFSRIAAIELRRSKCAGQCEFSRVLLGHYVLRFSPPAPWAVYGGPPAQGMCRLWRERVEALYRVWVEAGAGPGAEPAAEESELPTGLRRPTGEKGLLAETGGRLTLRPDRPEPSGAEAAE